MAQRAVFKSLIALALLLSAVVAGSAEARDEKARFATVEQRRVEALHLAIDRPFPKTACPLDADPGNACLWGKLGYAIAALYLARNDAELAAGNEEIREALIRLGDLPQDMAVPSRFKTINKRVAPLDRFIFFNAGLLQQIYFQFGSGSTTARSGRLTPANKHSIAALMWEHARSACRLEEADPTKTWNYKSSENISLFHNTGCWGMAEILSETPICSPCTYADGSSLQQQLQAWSRFLTVYIRQHAKYGGLIEFFSPTYYKYALQNFYNLAAFSSDPELRRLSAGFLDVWWAEWAQEQVGGWHGGSKARAYNTEIENQSVGTQLAWVYFGLGRKEPPGLMVSLIANHYQPPEIVNEIASDSAHRGSYVVQARAAGLLDPSSRSDREIDARAGGIVRYAYVTPAFVLALPQVPRIPLARWIPFSRQNRWGGLSLMGPGHPQYIFARPLLASDKERSLYNDLWGVQSLGTQIVQKMPAPLSHNAGRMAVWLSSKLKPERDGDWTFVSWGDAYAAFRPAFGGYAANSTADRVVLSDDTSPVIIQAALKSDFPDFESFKSAIRSMPVEVQSGYVRLRGLGKAGTITFYYKDDRMPEIDGTALNLSPPFAFDSPFLRAQWGEGTVTIRKGQREETRDFR